MATSRLLVTGGTGFVGGWVLRCWRRTRPEVEVWATSEKPRPDSVDAHTYRQVDLLDADAVRALAAECRPTHVIHLAGVMGSAPLATHLSVDVVGSDNLFRALLALGSDRPERIVQASSAATYGQVLTEELPIREDQTPRPVSPYGLAKLAQDYLALALARTEGLPVVLGRVFNLFGPGQPDTLVPMAFINQLREVIAGKIDRLQVGQTSSRRDFVDIRDVTIAFDRLLQFGVPGEAYNIGSGRDVAIQEVIDKLLVVSGLDVPVEVSSSRVRATDVPRVRADITKITTCTDWRPRITMDESLKAMWTGDRDWT